MRLSPNELLRRYQAGERDFEGARLLGESLRGFDLRGVSLRGANLAGADLVGANLDGADLRGASLRGANLAKTSLRDANLTDADLRDANARADFDGAHLRGARFTERGASLQELHEVTIQDDRTYREERLAQGVDPDWLRSHLSPDLDLLATPSESEDEWEKTLVFPEFQAWLAELENASATLAVYAALGAAQSTLPCWTALEASPHPRAPRLVCPPTYKLAGVASYVATPRDETLARLAGLIDYSSQDSRRFHDEMKPWLDVPPGALIDSQAGWCEEAADHALETLLHAVMGSYYPSFNVIAGPLWFTGMCALNAHRRGSEEPVQAALEKVVAGISGHLMATPLTTRDRRYPKPTAW
ncbi:MAG: pentapeptide repeat-containing protein [Myxococcota bacterium]